MGGIQTLNVGIPNLDNFAYLGIFSSGWWANPTPFGGGNDNEKYYKMLQDKKTIIIQTEAILDIHGRQGRYSLQQLPGNDETV